MRLKLRFHGSYITAVSMHLDSVTKCAELVTDAKNNTYATHVKNVFCDYCGLTYTCTKGL